MTPQEITSRLHESAVMFDESRDADLLGQLNDVIAKVSERYFHSKLNSAEWPLAADPMLICKLDSEEDKNIRASAIFSLLLAARVHSGDKQVGEKRVLDFGCGEGHVAKQIVNSGAFVVGYDIKEQGWSRWQQNERFTFTTNFEDVKSRGPYDLVFVYDVLDHAENQTPVELLKMAKEVMVAGGKIILRCHPWCSRHGTHLWGLNKAFAHLVFSEEELEKMGHKGISTLKVTVPDITYMEWFNESGLKVTWENCTWQQSGPIFENNITLKRKVIDQCYAGGPSIPYNLIEQVWRDFCLEVMTV